MRNTYFYEVLLTETHVDENSWLEFIFSISKINGWLRRFKIYIFIDTNEVKYYISTTLKMPPAIRRSREFSVKTL